jgi:hypothetical protein
LHPPTEKAALAHQDEAIAWVRSWHDAAQPGTQWEQRHWASLGTQPVPVRLAVATPEDAARIARREKHWRMISQRVGQVASAWGAPGAAAQLPAALRRHAERIAELSATDFDRLLAVLAWLVDHPESGLYARQLPIRGVDTKWLRDHRGVVTDLVLAVTGRPDLGLAVPPSLIRLRFLDRGLAPGGIADLATGAPHLAALDIQPATVFIFENLECVLAMAPFPKAVVIHGGGYSVDRLDAIGWIHGARVVYWGDLDTHGFAILARLRAHFPDASSALMDAQTFRDHRDLAVPEPKPSHASLQGLTQPEAEALDLVAAAGLRLEQERLPWPACEAALAAQANPDHFAPAPGGPANRSRPVSPTGPRANG